jgi:hypothetical protein
MNAQVKDLIPQGYRQNAQGHLVPESAIAPIDLERDELVKEIVEQARALQAKMREFKQRAMGDVLAFVDLAAERYDAKVGGLKGNLTLASFDGAYQLKIQVADRLVFDERLQIAKTLVDACIHKWTEGSRMEIRALVEHAFQTDREGKISTGRILSLTRLNIDDDDWRNAMQAIRDSMQVVGSTRYLRVYERTADGARYEQITLDVAAL